MTEGREENKLVFNTVAVEWNKPLTETKTQTPAGTVTAAWGVLWKMSLEYCNMQQKPGGSCARRVFNVFSQCPICVCVLLLLWMPLKLFVSIFRDEIHFFACLHIFVLPFVYNYKICSIECACCTNGTVAFIKHSWFCLESLLCRGKGFCMCSPLLLTHQAVRKAFATVPAV